LKCIHGRQVIDDIESIYGDNFISVEEIGNRYYPIDTMFALPEICLYSDIVEYFSDLPYNSMTYCGVFEDVNDTINALHRDGLMKNEILGNPDKYIKKDIRIPTLLERLRLQEKKTFLLTNSEYYYTNGVMKHLLGNLWKEYFDIVIVNGRKPHFFGDGTTLREVDEKTGNLKLSNISSSTTGFERGKIYNGGNLSLFKKFTKTTGGEVLYVGDSINHDVISSKENRCFWRTCLLLRELGNEIETWKTSDKQYQHFLNLEYVRAKTFQGMDSQTRIEPPDLDKLRDKIYQCQYDFDSFFNPYFGSVFRSGSKESYYSNQVMSFADLYTSDCLNFLNYPLFYYFTAVEKMYPHERQSEIDLIQKIESK
jgi:5'-nucleotidase